MDYFFPASPLLLQNRRQQLAAAGCGPPRCAFCSFISLTSSTSLTSSHRAAIPLLSQWPPHYTGGDKKPQAAKKLVHRSIAVCPKTATPPSTPTSPPR